MGKSDLKESHTMITHHVITIFCIIILYLQFFFFFFSSRLFVISIMIVIISSLSNHFTVVLRYKGTSTTDLFPHSLRAIPSLF